nr:hypothetical protein [uncultured Cellulosilyticum sp.]
MNNNTFYLTATDQNTYICEFESFFGSKPTTLIKDPNPIYFQRNLIGAIQLQLITEKYNNISSDILISLLDSKIKSIEIYGTQKPTSTLNMFSNIFAIITPILCTLPSILTLLYMAPMDVATSAIDYFNTLPSTDGQPKIQNALNGMGSVSSDFISTTKDYMTFILIYTFFATILFLVLWLFKDEEKKKFIHKQHIKLNFYLLCRSVLLGTFDTKA